MLLGRVTPPPDVERRKLGQRAGARRPGSSTSNHEFIQQYYFNAGANQLWTFVPLSNGNYVIVNAASGLVMDGVPLGNDNNNVDPGQPYGNVIDQGQLNVNALYQQWQTPPGERLCDRQRVQRPGARRPRGLDQ